MATINTKERDLGFLYPEHTEMKRLLKVRQDIINSLESILENTTDLTTTISIKCLINNLIKNHINFNYQYNRCR